MLLNFSIVLLPSGAGLLSYLIFLLRGRPGEPGGLTERSAMIEPSAILLHLILAAFGYIGSTISLTMLDYHGVYAVSSETECTQVGISPGMRIGFNGERILFGTKVACGIYGSSQTRGGYDSCFQLLQDSMTVSILLLRLDKIIGFTILAVVQTASNLPGLIFAAFTYFNMCGTGRFFPFRIIIESTVTSIYLVVAGATVDTVFKMGPKCIWSVLVAVFVWRYRYTNAKMRTLHQFEQCHTIGLRA